VVGLPYQNPLCSLISLCSIGVRPMTKHTCPNARALCYLTLYCTHTQTQTHTHKHTHTRKHTHTHKHKHKHTRTHTHAHTHKHTHTRTHTHTHTHTCVKGSTLLISNTCVCGHSTYAVSLSPAPRHKTLAQPSVAPHGLRPSLL